MTPVQYLEVPVGELRPNSFNPNRVTADNEKKIRASIARNGLFKPIIVRQVAGVPGYEIIGGEHRWDQAKALGYETVPIANLGEISDKRAKEICLIDNARYGADDTLTLSDILKDIGTTDELQDFLPYGDTDLAAIFSAASIDLSALNIPENNEVLPEIAPDSDSPATKPTRTHTIMRFKVSNEDAERLTKLVAKTQADHGYRDEDQLTNAGDALIHLLSGLLGSVPAPKPAIPEDEDWNAALAEIEAAQEQTK